MEDRGSLFFVDSLPEVTDDQIHNMQVLHPSEFYTIIEPRIHPCKWLGVLSDPYFALALKTGGYKDIGTVDQERERILKRWVDSIERHEKELSNLYCQRDSYLQRNNSNYICERCNHGK